MQARGFPALAISAATQENVQALLYSVKKLLDDLPPEAPPVEELPEITPPPDEKAFEIYQVADRKWYVEGIAIERAAAMTNWDYYEAGLRFQRILRAMGIADALRNAGIQDGDVVRIGDIELVWGYDNAFDE